MNAPFAAALFAGGRSKRFGSDKAFFEIDGAPLWQHQLAKVEPLMPSEILISANAGQDFDSTHRVVVDDEPDQEPLGGLVSCLRATKLGRLLVLAVDLPEMPLNFLGELVYAGCGAVPQHADGEFEPLAAVYPAEILPLARAQLAAGERRMRDLIETGIAEGLLVPRPVAESELGFFANLNQAPGGVEPMSDSSKEFAIGKISPDGNTEALDHIAREDPLEIRVEGKSVAVVMRTPGHDRELAAGFLLSEGVVATPGDVFEISECPSNTEKPDEKGNVVDVLLTKGANFDPEQLTRHVFTSSSCGICGKATIDSVFGNFPKIDVPPPLAAAQLATYPDKLRAAQATFEKTGGLHASAIFDPAGEIVVLREDVGRHNALDKVIGHALLEGMLPLSEHTLLLSGRVSFELMQKALAAGIPTVAAISAPSSLAVEFARESGQTLVGFLRGGTMNVYAGN